MTAGDQAPTDGDRPDSAPARARGSRAVGGEVPPAPEGGNGPSGEQGERLSYEQARDQLTEVVRRLEGGGLTLEQSLDLWERGERLAAICSDWLEGARARLAAASPGQEDGAGAQAPF